MAVASSNTAQWSSRFAFTLTAIGSSVGLGNLWRFSAEAGNNGGGAFIALYLACVILIGIPTLMAEFLIGRAGKASSVVNSMQDLAERSNVSTHWSLGAWVGMGSSFLILSFYAVVAAWVMAYIPKFLFGTFDGMDAIQIAAEFETLKDSPLALAPWFLIFLGLAIWLVSRGVNQGLEIAARLLMPAFFILLFCLTIYSLSLGWESGGTSEAVSFMFAPDWSKLSVDVAVSALGQAFFSIGLGMAMMIAYGSYLPRSINVPQSAVIIGLADTGVALMAGLAIFPIVFHFGLDFNAGAGLFFQTLPIALVSTPGGNLVGAAFFCLAFFAALTTALALLEPTAEYLKERTGITKKQGALYGGLAIMAMGTVCLFSIKFLDFLDVDVTATIMLPMSALIIVLFVGWRLDKAILADQLNDGEQALGRFLLVMVRYVAPFMIATILFAGMHDRYYGLFVTLAKSVITGII